MTTEPSSLYSKEPLTSLTPAVTEKLWASTLAGSTAAENTATTG